MPSTSITETVEQVTDYDVDSDSDANATVLNIQAEGGEFSDRDQNIAAADPDQAVSEEQTYREKIRGIRSYMGRSHIPDLTGEVECDFGRRKY